MVLREQLVSRRERQAQQELRKQTLKDQRDAFQRDTILSLQDAINQLWAMSADAFNQAAQLHAQTGEWPLIDLTELPDLNKVSHQIKALSARVFDDELRGLADEVVRGSGLASKSLTGANSNRT